MTQDIETLRVLEATAYATLGDAARARASLLNVLDRNSRNADAMRLYRRLREAAQHTPAGLVPGRASAGFLLRHAVHRTQSKN